jgi:hypothetical protein
VAEGVEDGEPERRLFTPLKFEDHSRTENSEGADTKTSDLSPENSAKNG